MALETSLKKPWFTQFIRFGLVGVTNTAVSYVIYSFTVWLGAHYFFGSVVAFIVSVAWSYMLNSHFVFRKRAGEAGVWWKTLAKTYVSYALTGLVLTNVLLYIWIDLLHINEYIAPIINLIFTIPVNFILNKFWAYNGRKP